MSDFAAGATPITIAYWNIKGLAAPLRMLAMYAGIAFVAKCYALDETFDRSEWLEKDKPALKDQNPFMNLPYVRDGNKLISQSNSCLSYLARKAGMWSSDEEEIILIETLLCELMDLRNTVVRFAYSATPDKVKDFLDSSRNILMKIENYLKQQSSQFSIETPFLVGGRVTAPDFHFYELLIQIDQINNTYTAYTDTAVFQDMPNVSSYFIAFDNLPRMQAYLASPLASLPANNLMANCGSLGNGGKWEVGTELPFNADGWTFSG